MSYLYVVVNEHVGPVKAFRKNEDASRYLYRQRKELRHLFKIETYKKV